MNAMRLMQDLGVFVIEGAIQNLHSQCDLDLLISGTWLRCNARHSAPNSRESFQKKKKGGNSIDGNNFRSCSHSPKALAVQLVRVAWPVRRVKFLVVDDPQ